MFAEYLFKYRMLKPWARLLILCLLGVLPAAWNYLDVAPILEVEQEEASNREQSARKKLADAKTLIKDLPAMEEKLLVTKDLLKKAEARLPNQIFVDEVLQFVSKSANESDVAIRKFEPMGNKVIEGDYPYNEVRFKISMDGRYGRLGEWLDTVAGSESNAYLKSWKIQRGVVLDNPEVPGEKNRVEVSSGKHGTKEEAESIRERLKLGMDTELVLYSAISETQLAAIAAAAALKAEAAEKKPGEQPKDNKPAEEAKAKPGGRA